MNEFWIKLVGRMTSALLSLIDSTNLRNRVYELKSEHELMWTALDDITRMDKTGKMGRYAQQTLAKIPNRYDV